jgi:hypothetical protein
VALIAEPDLTSAVRRQIQDILFPGTTLADAAVWPDHEGRSLREIDPLHYVSIPDGAPGYDQARDNGSSKDQEFKRSMRLNA